MKPLQRIKVTLCAFNHCDFRWIMLKGRGVARDFGAHEKK